MVGCEVKVKRGHLAGGMYYWWINEANTCDVCPFIEAILGSGLRSLLSASYNH